MALTRNLIVCRIRTPLTLCVRSMGKGEPGSGSGEGGGAGGVIRDAGGAFGKREAAQEEQYFRKLNEEQIKKMREGLKDEIGFHEKQIKAHQEAIKRHKKRIDELD
ncbi:ATPase inhibitor mai-2, mitochondrial-like isoform X1 [Macrobrachium rosenbergii]|uniref:ATPase inhibitor mai-2, mitochondrial-like isoform X1 n=1 Tax=Macrobrachium rosenbergii TaxID=79674 RepID=UPI0010B4BF41